MIAIDLIRDVHDVRHIQPTLEQDAGLEASIRSQGVLQPILVTPDKDNPGGFVIWDGRRRLRSARAIGLTEIPALVLTGLAGGWDVAAALAANMQRAPLHPLDQWRGVRELVSLGLDIQTASAAIGLDDRKTRRMELLGRLHPDIQALIERFDTIPPEFVLRKLANAPLDLQAKAAVAPHLIRTHDDGDEDIHWHVAAQVCTVTRYSRAHALFDPDLIAWDVDWLAQPGSEDEYTTSDEVTFMRRQEDVLEDFVAAMTRKKRKATLLTGPDLPKGFIATRFGPFELGTIKLSDIGKAEALFLQLKHDGRAYYAIATDTKAAKAATAQSVLPPDDDGGDADDTPARSVEPPPGAAEPGESDGPGLTKRGIELLWDAKTTALRQTLRTRLQDEDPALTVALLILTFCADNITIMGPIGRRDFDDLAARLLLPGGGLDETALLNVNVLAGELMARVLTIGNGGNMYQARSGDAAEWIGDLVDADTALPRFDTTDFLDELKGDALRRAADTEDKKSSGPLKAIREALAGHAPQWRPDGAVFGAPAPTTLPWAGHDAPARACRVCGCTDDDCTQCIEKTGQRCHWVEPDLCSACQTKATEGGEGE